jgi:hypothetical protein
MTQMSRPEASPPLLSQLSLRPIAPRHPAHQQLETAQPRNRAASDLTQKFSGLLARTLIPLLFQDSLAPYCPEAQSNDASPPLPLPHLNILPSLHQPTYRRHKTKPACPQSPTRWPIADSYSPSRTHPSNTSHPPLFSIPIASPLPNTDSNSLKSLAFPHHKGRSIRCAILDARPRMNSSGLSAKSTLFAPHDPMPAPCSLRVSTRAATSHQTCTSWEGPKPAMGRGVERHSQPRHVHVSAALNRIEICPTIRRPRESGPDQACAESQAFQEELQGYRHCGSLHLLWGRRIAYPAMTCRRRISLRLKESLQVIAVGPFRHCSVIAGCHLRPCSCDDMTLQAPILQ